MGNTVYAWDADTGETLWQTQLGTPINGCRDIDAWGINAKVGYPIHSVSSIAPPVRFMPAPGSAPTTRGNWRTGQHYLVALGIVTGRPDPAECLSLEGAQLHFRATASRRSGSSRLDRKQRAALAMVDGAVIICFGTIAETPRNARGWVIAVDTAELDHRGNLVLHRPRQRRRHLDVRRRPGNSERRLDLAGHRQWRF